MSISPHAPQSDSSGSYAFLGRQPVLGRNGDTWAYQLLYRHSFENQATFADAHDATSAVLLNTFMELGLERVVGPHQMLIHLPRRTLLEHYSLLLPRERVLLVLPDDFQGDIRSLATLRFLLRQRFRFVLSDHDIDEGNRALAQIADYTRADITRVHTEEIKSLVARLRANGLLDAHEYARDDVRAHSRALGAALSTIRRTAEAAALRVVLNETMKGTDTPVVVLGDYNDGQLSNTLAIVTEQPAYRLFEDSRRGSTSDRGLYAAGTLQEFRSLRDVYFTHIHNGVRESLDHVLVSEQFYDHSRKRIWSFEQMRLWNHHLDDEEPSTSDHGLVVARFRHDPA